MKETPPGVSELMKNCGGPWRKTGFSWSRARPGSAAWLWNMLMNMLESLERLEVFRKRNHGAERCYRLAAASCSLGFSGGWWCPQISLHPGGHSQRCTRAWACARVCARGGLASPNPICRQSQSVGNTRARKGCNRNKVTEQRISRRNVKI